MNQDSKPLTPLKGTLVLCLAGLCACASDPWPAPDGAPPNIVAACREQAAIIRDENVDNWQELPGNEIAGSADDTIEDARAGRKADSNGPERAEAFFYRCMDGNGFPYNPQT